MRKSSLLLAGLVFLGMLGGGGAAAALSFDDNATFGDTRMLYGAGENGGFTVDRRNGVEVALRAQLRFGANNQPQNIYNSNGDGTYTFPTGTPNLDLPHPDWATITTPVWNVTFSVNLDHEDRDGTPGSVFTDYTYEVGMDFDPDGTDNWLRFDPIRENGMLGVLGVPDHAFGLYTQTSPGVIATTSQGYLDALNTFNITQNTTNPEFLNMDLTAYGMGDYSGFDPNVDGVYDIYLAVFSGATEIARSSIKVIVGNPPITPNVINDTQEEAEQAILDAGLVVGPPSYQYDPSVPAGTVIGQIPPSGTELEPGQEVILILSSGPEPDYIPEPVTFGDLGTSPSDPPKMLYGSGINGAFTVARGGGVELGLRAQLRFDENNHARNIFNSNNDGTYRFPAGTPNLALPHPDWATTTTPVWNVTYAVNTDYEDRDGTPSAVLADYTYEVGIDFDPEGTDNWLRFDPISINGVFNVLGVPDHAFGLYPQQSPGLTAATVPDYEALLSSTNIVHNTANAEFLNLDLTEYGMGDYSTFDPNQEGVYTVYLAAFDGGVEIARTEIRIIIENPLVAPNVTGMTRAEAETALAALGLTLGTVNYAHSDTVPAGGVISQSPLPGVEMNPGDAVSVVLSSGPEPYVIPEPVTFGDISTGPSDPQQLLTGSGMINGAFTVDRNGGVELGLRAQLRFDENNQPQNIFNFDGAGVYTFAPGTPNLALPHPDWATTTTPVWGIVFSVNSDHEDRDGTPSAVLADYTYEVGMDFDPSPGTGNWLTFDPISSDGMFNVLGVPDHAFGLYTQQSPGLTAATAPDYEALLTSVNIVQNGANAEFFNSDFTEYGYGDYSGFDPNQEGVYTVYLAAFDDGVEVARTEIQVVVGAAAATAPDVVGLPQADAAAAITGAGFTVGAVANHWNDTVPVGAVVSQDPAAGTVMAAGQAVSLVVSAGPQPPFEPEPVTFGDISEGPSDPMRMLYGAGTNGSFTVGRGGGVEVGLRGQLRFDANNQPRDIYNNNFDGTYSFPTGTPNLSLPHPTWATTTTPVWNVVLAVNTDYEDRDGTPAATLADYTYEMGVDFDPTAGTDNWLVFDPISSNGLFNTLGVPDHALGLYTQQSPGIIATTPSNYAAAIAACNIAQNTGNYEFMNLDLSEYGYGDFSGFDPNEPGIYNVYLAVLDGDTEIARTEIQILVGAPILAPDVVGLAEADAAAAITGAGLVVGTTDLHWSDTVAAGDVVSQDPAPDTVMTAGQAVNLVVSAGPQPPFEPEPVTFGDISVGPNDPMQMLFGTGIANGGFTVGRGGGVELGLRAQLRFDANNQPQNIFNSNGDGTYSFPTGTPNLALPHPSWASETTPVWGLVFSVNTDDADRDGTPSSVLADYTFEAGVDFDPAGTGNWLVFDPISDNGLFNTLGVPDHAFGVYTQQHPGLTAATPAEYTALLATANIVQNAANYEFLNMDLTEYGYGDYSGFDPNVPGVYTVYLAALSGGVEVARTEIQVVVGDVISVPALAGMTVEEAETALTTAGLILGTVTPVYSDTVPAGEIISQDPVAGAAAGAGDAVSVVVSLGPEPVAVPNVVGMTQAAAEAALTGAGLTLGAVTESYSDTVPAGQVMSQTPAAGTEVAPGTAVAVEVSLGPAPVAVPNVVGLTQAAAESALAGAGLTLGAVTEAYSAVVPAGNVMGQTPVAGTEVAPGTAVDIEVSLGPAPVAVPNVVGLTQAAAEAALADAGLVLGAVTESYSATVPAGEVMSQTPAAGTELIPGAAVDIEVSLGPAPVAVPNVVGLTRAAAEAALTGAGLTLGAVTESYSAVVPAGEVMSQTPVAGTEVAPGTAVAVEVSLGPAPVKVPYVVGLTRAAAEAALTGAGLTLGAVTESYSATVPAGNVMGQTPVGGTEVLPGAAVAIEVSLGPDPSGDRPVPNVAGLTRAEAEAAFAAAGLTLGAVTEAYSEILPAGVVVSQNPPAGTQAAPGTAVSIVLSKGPAPIRVPNVVNRTRASAEGAITAARLVVGTVTEEYSATFPAGRVISQNPAGGVEVGAGSAVDLVVSRGPRPTAVEVPDVTGLARSAAEAALTAAGFAVGAVAEEYSGVVAAGAVVRQDPPGRVSAEPGTPVALSVSLGADPESVETARELLAEAFEALDADGSGALTLAEARERIWNMTPLLFAALDVNGDGVLDRDELEIGGCGGCGGCGKAGLSPTSLKSRLGDLFLGALSLVVLGAVSRVGRG